MKTDNPEIVGTHVYELAGLGKPPYRYCGMEEKYIAHSDGSTQASGTCDKCGMGIRYVFYVQSSDGKCSGVGCECILKSGDRGLIHAYKTSKEKRQLDAKKRQARAERTQDELAALIAANSGRLQALPHPRGFSDRKTGEVLTLANYVEWMMRACGAAGRARLLKELKGILQCPSE